MEYSVSRHWCLILISFLLAGSLGCQLLPTAAPAATAPAATAPAATAPAATAPASDQTPQSVSIEVEMEFGPGSLDLADLRVGLAEVSSYKSTLTISFDGTKAGQAVSWSSTYTYAATNAPAARQLMIESTGVEAEPPVWMAELNGVAYERAGEEACTADVLDSANSIAQELEPAAQLPSLFGADEAGTDTVNGAQAAHYTFDERALAEYGLNKSAGELWLASEGGYVLRYLQTTTGDADYFGDDTQGTLAWDYELTEVNQPLTIELPADCPPGLVDAPLLPDAAKLEILPGLVQYETATSVEAATAFYQRELAAKDWMPLGEPSVNEGVAFMVFDRGGQRMRVIIAPGEPATQVLVLLSKSEE